MEKKRVKNIYKNYVNREEKKVIKSDFSKALIIAGSKNYPFAGLLAMKGTKLFSPGYLALTKASFNSFAYLAHCFLDCVFISVGDDKTSYLIDDSFQTILKYDSILFGNGVEESESNLKFLDKLIKEFRGILIIDATGIRLLKRIEKSTLLSKRCTVIITPHMKEAQDLFSSSLKTRDVSSYLTDAVNYSKKYDIYCILKSYDTLLVHKDKYVFERYDTPSLAKAGSGDFFAGMLLGSISNHQRIPLSLFDCINFTDNLFHMTASLLQKKKNIRLIDYNDLYEQIKNM